MIRHEGLRETNWYWNFTALPKPRYSSHILSWYLIITCLFLVENVSLSWFGCSSLEVFLPSCVSYYLTGEWTYFLSRLIDDKKKASREFLHVAKLSYTCRPHGINVVTTVCLFKLKSSSIKWHTCFTKSPIFGNKNDHSVCGSLYALQIVYQTAGITYLFVVEDFSS